LKWDKWAWCSKQNRIVVEYYNAQLLESGWRCAPKIFTKLQRVEISKKLSRVSSQFCFFPRLLPFLSSSKIFDAQKYLCVDFLKQNCFASMLFDLNVIWMELEHSYSIKLQKNTYCFHLISLPTSLCDQFVWRNDCASKFLHVKDR
jgi:hypothetical protein